MGRVAEYGRGHPKFLTYAKRIVEHPAYAGMPDPYLEDGEIQWEAPSNRPGGKFQFTHQRRLDWWRRRAREIGIDPDHTPRWISETAKGIHPFKKKPCKNCGLELDIRYAYPSALLIKRVLDLPYVVGERFETSPIEHIVDLLERLIGAYGSRVIDDFPRLLRNGRIGTPALPNTLAAWLEWIDRELIPAEPSILSPGVMSNAPDRFDGFHSFNRCCREKADRGRSKSNLQSYITDRRAFEYWVEGDWIAADRLIGFIRSRPELQAQTCRHGHPGPCAADHIGPISLGFMHRPEFQFLCRACNSAKNNRLMYTDCQYLKAVQQRGEGVASWYCEELWLKVSRRVHNQETALRLSKMMRDARHTAMVVLGQLAGKRHLVFLCSLLGLEYAQFDIEFDHIVIEDHIARFEGLQQVERSTRYVQEQKARRIRVAFSALSSYLMKEHRNALLVLPSSAQRKISRSLALLHRDTPGHIHELNERLEKALEEASDEGLRRLVDLLPSAVDEPKVLGNARSLLRLAMDDIGDTLNADWKNPRYVRAEDSDAD